MTNAFIMKRKFDNVCFVTTIYALLIYLLHSDLEIIENTLFVFSDTFPKNVGIRLPSHIFLKDIINKKNIIIKFFFYHPKISWIYYKYIRWKLFSYVNKEYKIYAQDHLYFSSTIIGNHDYTLIEDSKDFFSQEIINKRPLSSRSRILTFFIGEAHSRSIGRNRKCIELLSTSNNVAKELKHKKNTICDIHREWEIASDAKKDLIKSIYGVNEDIIKSLKSFDAILFTQNLYFYPVISKEEQVELYRKIIGKYPSYKFIIKPHPIDKIEYERYIDNIKVLRSDIPIPSQLLSLMGVKFKKYITIFSSAINDLDAEADIDWYGTEVDERLMRRFGRIPIPQGVNLCSL